ncbi:MAG: DNA topoisomerase IV subunit A [Proteobacteria bacterium]|nr:DNA topoisomerase IV subunit A [Pseudomonadota bacterium]
MSIHTKSDQIQPTPFGEALSERYLSYALSTIMSRSLPDVRDGLKPVHRRLLYAMRLLKLSPGAGFKKCARVVGDVIGKYHPHGDRAVYDALVRLAQDFAVRYPLIDGQGNFGNVDGDNAAAMRYTEARLTEIADSLMQGLDENAVDFRETYDGEDEEPLVFPAEFPNLLANGSTGIAVGMATSVPPHNAGELIDGLLMLVEVMSGKRKQFSINQLVNRIPGPDFPTGGIIVEPRDSILQAYETGRGGFRLRARWQREDLGRGGYQIVVTEIPYQVQKSRLIEKIAELINDKRLPILSDVRDESAEEIRIVLEPRSRAVDANVLMESLFRLTELETRVQLNLNVLDANQVPRVMSLREALEAFLEHRIVVVVRRANFRLEKIEHRMEMLSGYLVAYLNLDEVIRIIRERDKPKPVLMKRFELTDIQAEAILNMRLRSLRKLEELEIKAEFEELGKERKGLKALLKSKDKQWDVVTGGLREMKAKFGPKTKLGARRTSFEDAPMTDVVPLEAMIEKEPVTVVCSKMGWVRALKGHMSVDEEVRYKEGDGPAFRFHAHTTDRIIAFATNGKAYTIGAEKLPGGRGNGEPIRLMLNLDSSEEILALFVYREGARVIVASSAGKGFLVETEKLVASTRGGRQVMNVANGSRASVCRQARGDSVAVLGENRKLLIFPLADLPVMARGQGVTLQRYKEGGLADLKTFTLEEGLSWRMGGAAGRTRTELDLENWQGRRGNAGRLVPKGFPARKSFD